MLMTKKLGVRALLTHRGYWKWSAAVQLLRLPPIMASLAFVLVSNYVTGSAALGGLLVTVYICCVTFFAAPMGRFIDRRGLQHRVPLLLLVTALAFVLMAIAAAFKAPSAVLIALVALAGIFGSSTGGVMRIVLSNAVPADLLPSALALDATVIEVVVICAPLLATLTALPSPPGSILAMGITMALSAFFVWNLQRGLQKDAYAGSAKPEPAEAPSPQALWGNRRFIFWLLVSIAFGHALATAEVGAFPLATHFGGDSGAAATMIVCLSVSSIAAGLVYSAFANRIALTDKWKAGLLLLLMVVSCFGLALSSNRIEAIIAMCVIGACTAPLMTVRSLAVEDEIPATRKAEGFGLVNSAHGVGYALGGLLLAVLPLSGMLIAGGISGAIVLLSLPVLMQQRRASREYQDVSR
jgi:MFS family permease